MAKKSALGKGLGALLSDAAEEAKPRGTASSALQEELKLSDIRSVLPRWMLLRVSRKKQTISEPI